MIGVEGRYMAGSGVRAGTGGHRLSKRWCPPNFINASDSGTLSTRIVYAILMQLQGSTRLTQTVDELGVE